MSFLANWRPGRLLLAWCGYWIALLLALVGPGIPALLRVAKPGGSGSASVSVGDGALKLSVAEGASTVWALDAAAGRGRCASPAAVGALGSSTVARTLHGRRGHA